MRTTCRATCQRRITREFGLKTGKKCLGGEKSNKKRVSMGATVTKDFFFVSLMTLYKFRISCNYNNENEAACLMLMCGL